MFTSESFINDFFLRSLMPKHQANLTLFWIIKCLFSFHLYAVCLIFSFQSEKLVIREFFPTFHIRGESETVSSNSIKETWMRESEVNRVFVGILNKFISLSEKWKRSVCGWEIVKKENTARCSMVKKVFFPFQIKDERADKTRNIFELLLICVHFFPRFYYGTLFCSWCLSVLEISPTPRHRSTQKAEKGKKCSISFS